MFQSERAEKMSRSAFWRIVSQAGERAGLPVKAYAHQLRHAKRFRILCGIRRSIRPDSLAVVARVKQSVESRAPASPRTAPCDFQRPVVNDNVLYHS